MKTKCFFISDLFPWHEKKPEINKTIIWGKSENVEKIQKISDPCKEKENK